MGRAAGLSQICGCQRTATGLASLLAVVRIHDADFQKIRFLQGLASFQAWLILRERFQNLLQ